jgi:hypothetical protein
MCRHSFCISQIAKSHVVSLKRFDKALGYSVGLRAFNRCGDGLDVQALGKGTHFFGTKARAVIGQKRKRLGAQKT